MATNDYIFQTRWELAAPIEQVFHLIEQTDDYPRWWGSVWLQVERLAEGDANGIGRRYRLFTKGWLPYRLRWESLTLEKIAPTRIRIAAEGDFRGEGVWTLTAQDVGTLAVYDWRLRAEKPLLRWFSWLLKPVFRWNHHWAMRQGLAALKRELRI